MPKPDIHVLIAAAGSGTRFNSHDNIPKQYRILCGKSVIKHTIEAFLQCDRITSIRCIIDPKHEKMYHDAISGLDIAPFITGSKTRKKSVYNGLKSLDKVKNEDIILIHDAARPLVSVTDINALIDTLKTTQAATLARPAVETLRKENSNKTCSDIVPRDNLWTIQTPQGFRYNTILKAHENAVPNIEYTDDTSLVTALDIPVYLVEGSAENFKITTQSDFIMAKKLCDTNTTIRTGTGYDVHAFDINAKGPVRICGIDIPYIYKLKGHSDADVGLHAITDAILGAIAEGDIGQHFPPSDNTYKNMDSAIFLEKTIELVKKHNATLNNIDITIICEEPKIGPYAPQMRQRIASITGLPAAFINIKATTSEKLGFTGRKEGIAAQAIATVKQYV